MNPKKEKTILLLEDDLAFRSLLARSLEKKGYACLSAATIEEADRFLDGPIWAAILDLRLGAETSLKFLPELKRSHPLVMVVILTGFGSIATAVQAMKLGALHYFTKPVLVEDILKVLEGKSNLLEEQEGGPFTVDRLEWEHIQGVLQQVEGNVSEAARRLGMHRRTLQRKLKKRPYGPDLF